MKNESTNSNIISFADNKSREYFHCRYCTISKRTGESGGIINEILRDMSFDRQCKTNIKNPGNLKAMTKKFPTMEMQRNQTLFDPFFC